MFDFFKKKNNNNDYRNVKAGNSIHIGVPDTYKDLPFIEHISGTVFSLSFSGYSIKDISDVLNWLSYNKVSYTTKHIQSYNGLLLIFEDESNAAFFKLTWTHNQ